MIQYDILDTIYSKREKRVSVSERKRERERERSE